MDSLRSANAPDYAGEGNDEAQLRTDLADFNSDEVESKLEVLSEEEQDLEREAQELYAAHDQAVRERAAAEHGIGAEVAAQQRSSAEAELIKASREWAVLKLGALLLGTAIDRRRATQHDPLMQGGCPICHADGWQLCRRRSKL